VFNDSLVLPARVFARRPSGGSVELVFLRPLRTGTEGGGECWELLARPSHRLRASEELILPDGERLTLRDSLGHGRWLVSAPPGRSMVAVMDAHGRMPLPPYIKTYPDDPSTYQTVYASVPGSAAAPTAGLHFTPELLDRLASAGIESARVTLHVGLDTFLPIRERVVEDHRIHTEIYSVSHGAVRTIRRAVATGSRIVAVGTTATRVLETLAAGGVLAGAAPIGPVSGATDIFITPGHRFAAVDVLLTNLHVPRSSVLALTMAFAGPDRLRAAYAEAVALGYRFFSFGDAMLIDRLGGHEADQEGLDADS
jgi:S-adenosylmethionine:tRNA ribosyltransferase-isomerase